jgi:MtrB/PioB family decaheme-associated outer membrane protein
MTTRTRSLLRRMIATAVLVVAILLLMPKAAIAQEEERGQIEVGVRQVLGDRDAIKFKEYRDIPNGLYIQRFELNLNNLLNDRYFLNYQTRESIEKDQSHLLSTGMNGKFRFLFRWDETPHGFTNSAKSFYANTGGGRFTVPAVVRGSLQTTPANLNGFLSGAPVLNVGLRRNTAGGEFRYTPTVNWNFDFGYSHEKQFGSRPFGSAIYFTNTIEHPEPIDYRTQNVRAQADFGKRSYALQFGYSGSFFKNRNSTLVWDNPFRASDIVDGPASGRIDLYPDNNAHSLSVAGLVNLPGSTRFMGSLVRGWMRQNDAFVPFTTNTAIPNVPELPAASLDGRKQTLAMNYTLTNRAIPALFLTARYRSYDYANDSRSLIFSNYVATDAHLEGMARRNLPYAFNQETAGLDAIWSISNAYALKLTYDWDRLDREHRDVSRSIENTGGVAFDLTPYSWFSLRSSYKHGERKPNHYEANEESFPYGEGAFGMGQIEGLEKFDEAQRARDRAEAILNVDPTERLAFSASYGTTQDTYKASLFGLKKSIDYNVSFDLIYNLDPGFAVFAEYTREQYRYRLHSRQRSPANATTSANDTSNNDWESRIGDVVHTWGGGFDGAMFDHRLSFQAFYNLSTGYGQIRTRALGTPSITGFLVTTAQDYPNTTSRFHQLGTVLKYRLRNGVSPKFEYRLERYDRLDFQIDRMTENMSLLDPSMATSIFLGANFPGYTTHILAAGFEYRF